MNKRAYLQRVVWLADDEPVTRQRTFDNLLPESGTKNNSKHMLPPKNREELVSRLIDLKDYGWIQTRHQVNDGLVGNTLEDYLHIKENNLQLPDSGKYEIKSQRLATSSLTTLFHLDPLPRKPESVVSRYLGPTYGWEHKTLKNEWSFRVTMYGHEYTNRGFKVAIDEHEGKLLVDFDPTMVDAENQEWLCEHTLRFR